MSSEQTFEWQFGGWHGLPPVDYWLGLLFLAVGGGVLSIWFYRRTLRVLSPGHRVFFALLRIGFFLSLLLCLAGPARVERVYDSERSLRPLAVVVDRSQSMTVADLRGETRLSRAVGVWKKVEAGAVRFYPDIRYFRFSSALASAPDLESAVKSSDAGTETHLYDALEQTLKTGPAGGYGGVVCLTDGLDTTKATSDALVARAVQNRSPLYFAIGENEQAAVETLLVREIAVPARVLRKSRFTATALVEAHQMRERDVPLTLSQDDKPIAQTTLHLRPGTNLIPWPVPVDAGEPGLVHLSYRLGTTENETLAAAVPVVEQDKVHVLFYQGALDWGFRFIDSALRRDASFVLTGLFNPNLNMTQVTAPAGQPVLGEMPDRADGLKPFQIVVLSNFNSGELSPTQQQALLDYVQAGGGLFFLVSDTAMAQTFSGTALEQVLPVIFEAPPPEMTHSESVQQFQDLMHQLGGVDESQEGQFAADALTQTGPESLKSFALPPNPRRSAVAGLFAAGPGSTLQTAPRFVTYAQVHGVKAGGEILAVQPDDKGDSGEPRALLVTQRYGQGQVTALLTDSLWRWRLSTPSASHDPEVFWQQLFLALAKSSTPEGPLRFARQPDNASLGQPCSFLLTGPSKAPVITALSPQGHSQVLTPQAEAQPGSWAIQLTPQEAGEWRLRAESASGAAMETVLRVSLVSHTAELSGLPADVEGLRRLAEATGGCLLNDGAPDAWSAARVAPAPTLVSKRVVPIWNNWTVMLVGLGLYVTELIWRRRARLL